MLTYDAMMNFSSSRFKNVKVESQKTSVNKSCAKTTERYEQTTRKKKKRGNSASAEKSNGIKTAKIDIPECQDTTCSLSNEFISDKQSILNDLKHYKSKDTTNMKLKCKLDEEFEGVGMSSRVPSEFFEPDGCLHPTQMEVVEQVNIETKGAVGFAVSDFELNKKECTNSEVQSGLKTANINIPDMKVTSPSFPNEYISDKQSILNDLRFFKSKCTTNLKSNSKVDERWADKVLTPKEESFEVFGVEGSLDHAQTEVADQVS